MIKKKKNLDDNVDSDTNMTEGKWITQDLRYPFALIIIRFATSIPSGIAETIWLFILII